MFVTVKSVQGVVQLTVKGFISGPNVNGLVGVVIENLSKRIERVVVDLKECRTMSSSVISALILLCRELEKKGIPLYIDNLSEMNRKIYDQFHLEKELALLPSDQGKGELEEEE